MITGFICIPGCHESFESAECHYLHTAQYTVQYSTHIEEGLKQKTRQNVVVLDWRSRSNAALGNFGVKVCVHRCCIFSLYFCGGGMFYVDLYFKFYTETAKSLNTIQ